MDQRTEEWFEARRGKFTASRVYDLIPGPRGGSAALDNYIMEVALERVTGYTEEGFFSQDMQNGIDREGTARALYEAQYESVTEVGFILHPDIPYLGGSPDGLIEIDGGLEIKCPKAKTHLKTLQTMKIETRYLYQIQCNMMCSGRSWWAFVSYHPGFPFGKELVRIIVKKDPVVQTEIKIAVEKAEKKVQEIVKYLEE